MGIKDITQKDFFADDQRFADFINAVCLKGRKVLKSEELMTESVSVRKADEVAVLERTCDVVKKQTKDGAKSLRELVNIPEDNEGLCKEMQELLPDYKIKVYDLNKEKDFSTFGTALRTIFEFYSKHNDGNAMKKYMDTHYEEVEGLDKESRFFLSKMLGTKKWENALKSKKKDTENEGKEEEQSMCKAIEELIEMGRQEGLEQGRAESEKIITESEAVIEELNRKLEEQKEKEFEYLKLKKEYEKLKKQLAL